MPLEDLTGASYITDLNELWPLGGTDYPSAGDDHIRGIKNVLRNSFPNIAGPVTASDTEINRGAVPVGSVCVFYQASAPEGWQRVPDLDTTWGLRVVSSYATGGGYGGSMDPALNAVVPSHIHGIALESYTPTQDTSHTHAGAALAAGAHSHVGAGIAGGTGGAGLSYQAEAGPGGTHAHTLEVDHTQVIHTHHVYGNTAYNVGGTAWTPRYLDVILCQRIE
jgi:hypothetical protein